MPESRYTSTFFRYTKESTPLFLLIIEKVPIQSDLLPNVAVHGVASPGFGSRNHPF